MEQYSPPAAAPAVPATPPHSTEAERCVLGSMLLSQPAADLALERLDALDFFTPAHQDIFSVIRILRDSGRTLDTVTLIAELDKQGKLRAVGDAPAVMELSVYTPTAANVEQYIDIVEERSILRQLMAAGGEIAGDALAGERPVPDILSDAERRIYDISMRRSADTLLPIQDTMYETYGRMGELMNLKGKLTGVPTGFLDLDSMTSGLQRSDLIIIAGRPSMGKTSFAMNIAQYAAFHGGASVAVFSLEMDREQLIMRMFCTEAEVNMQSIKNGTATTEDMMKIAEVLPLMEAGKLYIDDTAGATVPEIRSKCRRHKARHGLDMIVIDYLQPMRTSKKADNRQQEISDITRSLKILARELSVPILLLSQLSRAPEQRADHTPVMADLRESGAIEQDADLIMLLYREQVYDPSADNTAQVIVAKNRNGPTAPVDLWWMADYTKFKNVAYEN